MFIQSVGIFFNILYMLMLARVILSWIRPNIYNRWYSDLMNVLYALTEPILEPIRNLMPGTGMVDFSPMIALILLSVVQRLVISLLYSIL